MIYVTRLNHTPVVLNSELIEHVETTPDTVISLTTGQRLMVLESPREIIDLVIRFRRSIYAPDARGMLEPNPGRSGAASIEGANHGG